MLFGGGFIYIFFYISPVVPGVDCLSVVSPFYSLQLFMVILVLSDLPMQLSENVLKIGQPGMQWLKCMVGKINLILYLTFLSHLGPNSLSYDPPPPAHCQLIST